MRAWILAAVFAAAPSARAAHAQPPAVDFGSLLRALVDASPEGPVGLPVAASLVSSSRDQGSVAPSEPGSWFSESDAGNVTRVERVDGRSEWVLADLRGAGAVTRIALSVSSTMRDGVLRVRIDGEQAPSIEWPLRAVAADIAARCAPFVAWHPKPPMPGVGSAVDSDEDAGVLDCILPIPFASSCVVTIDRRPDLYRVESLAFAEGTRVERLPPDACGRAPESAFATVQADAMKRLARGRPAALPATPLASGRRIERAVGASGEPARPNGGVIRRLSIQIDPFEAERAVRELWIECDFDGERAIRLPLGAFIGLGDATGPTADAFRSVAANGAMEFRLPMPFAREARIALANRGRTTLACALEIAEVGDRSSADPPYLLHGGWRMYPRLSVERPIEVELARIEGAGVLAGSGFSRIAALPDWPASGDDRLRIDGRDELAGPSQDLAFGSGPRFPRLARGVLVSVPPGTGDPQEVRWSASRLRTLDGVRFSQSLVETLEVLPASEPGCETSLSHSVFWYARAGASRGVGFDDPEWMPAVATPRNLAPLSELFPAGPGEEWFEAEDLSVSFWTKRANWAPENLGIPHPTKAWGSGERVGMLAVGVGDSIELVVPARDASPRRITGRFVRTDDAARVAVSVNGVRVPGEITLDALEPEPSDLIDLGVHLPKDGRFLVRFTAAGFGQYARRRMHIQIDGIRTSPP